MLVRISSLVLVIFLVGCGDKKEKRSDAPKQAPSTSLVEGQQGVDSEICKLEGNIRGFRLTCEKDITAVEIDGVRHEDRLYFNSDEKTVLVRVKNILGGADSDKESLRFVVVLEDGRTTEVVVNTSGQPVVSGEDLDLGKFTIDGAKADEQRPVVEKPTEEKKKSIAKDSGMNNWPESLTSQGYVLSTIDPNFYVKLLPNAIVYVSKNFVGDDHFRRGIIGFSPLIGSNLRYGDITVSALKKEGEFGWGYATQTTRLEGMQFLSECSECIDFRVNLYGSMTGVKFTVSGRETYIGDARLQETASFKIQ